MNTCPICGGPADQSSEPMFSSASSTSTLLMVLGLFTEDEMVRYADGILNMQIIIDHEFRRRFPARYATWEHQIESDGAA